MLIKKDLVEAWEKTIKSGLIGTGDIQIAVFIENLPDDEPEIKPEPAEWDKRLQEISRKICSRKVNYGFSSLEKDMAQDTYLHEEDVKDFIRNEVIKKFGEEIKTTMWAKSQLALDRNKYWYASELVELIDNAMKKWGSK